MKRRSVQQDDVTFVLIQKLKSIARELNQDMNVQLTMLHFVLVHVFVCIIPYWIFERNFEFRKDF